MTTLDKLAIARRAGITPAGAQFLLHVLEDGPIRPSDLAEKAGCTSAHVTGIVTTLERDGWVRRKETGNLDRRTKPIFATDKAFELFTPLEA
jgi:DNA-binding MarR family transcriptional regulator